ncbi:MAG: hypothetical protein L6R37_005368 [Teloschistes peruensis]|nr:MAG: hypothetical protein L6R37_005368 [Teloschistes peruensis]
MATEPTPPAWLRSYKAQSSIIPNFASQVKPDAESRQKPVVGGNPFGQDKAAEQKQIETESAVPANAFSFPSTISLTIHNGLSLDRTYSNSTPNSSPKQPSFNRDANEKTRPDRTSSDPTIPDQKIATPVEVPTSRRRGPICRFLAIIGARLKKKTQNTLAH